MRQHIRTAFAVGGYPHAWAPNRPNTVAAKGHSRVLHRSRGRGRSGLEAATSVTVSEVGRELAITMHTSALGRFHQEGRKGPWTIAPHGNYPLRFQVAGQNVGGRAVTGAEGRAVFQKRRARAQARRAATGRGRIPGRQYGVTVYALSVQHPGYPARPFLPDVNPHSPAGDAFLQAHWRVPLRDYLFGGTK